jgi:hypothetical protein
LNLRALAFHAASLPIIAAQTRAMSPPWSSHARAMRATSAGSGASATK